MSRNLALLAASVFVRQLFASPINGSTATPDVLMAESTQYYPKVEETQSIGDDNDPVTKIVNGLLYNHLYQIVAALALAQFIALCCLMLYCRKQSVTSKQIEDLSLKIDALMTNKCEYQKTFSDSNPSFNNTVNTASGFSPGSQTNTAPMSNNPVARCNSTPVNSNSANNNNPYRVHALSATDDNYVIHMQPSSQYSNAASDRDHEALAQIPWSPKTGNQTSLPPPPSPKMANNLNNINNTAINPNFSPGSGSGSAKFANAMSTMNTYDFNRNITASMTPSQSADVPGDGQRSRARDSVWSNMAHILEQGQSVMSVDTVGTRDSVNDDSIMGEMLGLNIKPRHQAKDVDVVLDEIEEYDDSDDVDKAENENVLRMNMNPMDSNNIHNSGSYAL